MPNVLLVTVTKVEAQAALGAFSECAGQNWERRHIGDKTYYALGQIGGVDVFMVQSEMGTSGRGSTLLTVRNAIDHISPTAVIMVGIAFGVDREKQQPGEILVSRQLMTYEAQKVTSQRKLIWRGDRVTVSIRLLDKFRSGDLDWTGARVRFGLVLSGEKLVNALWYRNQLLRLEEEAIGGEMEGAGLYAAAEDARVDWILVKAVCDWADGKKSDDHQPLAARNAAAFVLHVIKQGGLGLGEGPQGHQLPKLHKPPADLQKFRQLRKPSAREKLADHVLRQIAPMLEAEDRPIAAYLLARLDEQGFLPETPVESAIFLHVSPEQVDTVLRLIQHSDPPGLGARDSRESLLLQLDALAENGNVYSLARACIADHWQALVRRDLGRIAISLRVPLQQVVEADLFIRRNLTPYPARDF